MFLAYAECSKPSLRGHSTRSEDEAIQPCRVIGVVGGLTVFARIERSEDEAIHAISRCKRALKEAEIPGGLKDTYFVGSK